MTTEPFDLDAYFARIGYAGPVEPTLPVLQALVGRQSAAIAFENLDPIAGRPPALDLASLQTKMIAGRRGGYCFEQNTLLQAALDAVGFRTVGLIARVCRRLPPGMVLPRTHMLLRIDLPDGPYLADAGFGGLTPTAPLLMILGVAQPTPNEVFRLMRHEDETLLQVRLGDEWDSIYHFTQQTQLPVDYVMANWFTATQPLGVFTSNLIVTRPGPGTRTILFNRHFSIRSADGTVTRRVLASLDEVRVVLADTFDLVVTDADMAAIDQILQRQDAGADVPGPFS
jgi:N-hydroxyarylamine O-acetyltransferase